MDKEEYSKQIFIFPTLNGIKPQSAMNYKTIRCKVDDESYNKNNWAFRT